MTDEAHERYLRITEIISDLEKSSPAKRPSEWYDTHSDLMKHYAENLGKYSSLHLDEKTPEFRKNCELLDEISSQLLKDYNTHRWFSLYDYLRFNKLIVWAIEWICAEDELCDLLKVVVL